MASVGELDEPLLLDSEDPEADDESSTAFGAALGMIKCAIGAGTFALPFAFHEAGVGLAAVCTLALGALSVYTIVLLERAERAVAPAGANLSYPAVAARAFPGAVVGGVNAAEAACLAGVVCTCFGVCAAYVDFCAGVLPPIVSRYVGGTAGAPVFAAAISPVVFLLALIDSAKTLSFTSMLGNVAVAAGIFGVVGGGAGKREAGVGPLAKPAGVPSFFGSTVFLFAIHIVVLPIAHGMRPKRPAAKAPTTTFATAACWAFAVIAFVNAVFAGTSAVLFYRGHCHPSDPDLGHDYKGPCPNVLSNFATTSVALDVVILFFCANIVLTTPLILLAPRAILEPPLVDWARARGLPARPVKVAYRFATVALVLAVALGVPDFSDMVDLVGGVCNSLMGFVIPPLLHLKVSEKPSATSKVAHGAISVFGVVAMVYTTYTTVAKLARS